MLNGSTVRESAACKSSCKRIGGESVGKDRARDEEFVEWNGCWATVEWLAGAASRWASFYAKFDTKTSVFYFLSHDGDSFTSSSRSSVLQRRHNAKGLFLFHFSSRNSFETRVFSSLTFFFFSRSLAIVENSFSNAEVFCEHGVRWYSASPPGFQ